MHVLNPARACSGSQHSRQTTQAAAVVTPPGHLHSRHRRSPLQPSGPQPKQCLQAQLQQHGQQRRRHLVQTRAGPFDTAPAWTLDQIAGLAFGVVMLVFYFGSKEVDVFIAKQQRKQLGLCERCGGLNDPASCSEGSCPMKSKAV